MLEKYRNEVEVLLIPGAYKAGKIYGMNAKNGEIVPFNFARVGTATYFDKNGVMQTAASGVPRIDYDPISKVCKGYLLESASTNLVPWSSDFTKWTSSRGATVLTTIKTSYGEYMYSLTKNVAQNSTSITQIINALANTTYSFRKTFRAGNVNKATIVILTPDYTSATYGLDNEVAIKITGPGVVTKAGVGANWVITGLSTTEDTIIEVSRFIPIALATYFRTYSGETSSIVIGEYILMSCAQIEASTTCSSYIPTNGSQVTRPGDTLQSATDLLNNVGCSIFSQISSQGQLNSTTNISRGSAGASGLLYAVSGNLRSYDSTNIATLTTNHSQIREGKMFRTVTSWGVIGLSISIDGEYNRANYDGTMGSPGLLTIKHPATPRMYLKQCAIIPRQLTDLEHQELTEFTDETYAVLTYAKANNYTLPSRAYILKLESHIKALQASGVWNKLDVAYFMVGDGDLNFKTINIINPLISGTPIGGLINSVQGIKGNLIDGYIETNFIPSIGVNKYTLNDASYGGYVFDNGTGSGNNKYLTGSSTGNRYLLNLNSSINRINSASNLNVPSGFALTGFKALSRSTSQNVMAVQDGGFVDATSLSNGVSSGSQWVLRNTTVMTDTGISSFFMGGKLTFQESQFIRDAIINNL